MEEKRFKVGDRVKTYQGYRGIVGSELVEFSDILHTYNDIKQYFYLVQLYESLRSEDKLTYISILVCHPSNIELDDMY